MGLGLSLYSRGKYDEAVKALLAAADLNPSDPRSYVFLSKAYNSSPLQAVEVVQAFRRYADLQPNNALAQYYYAVSLWKGKRAEDTSLDQRTVETLLLKSVALDHSLAVPPRNTRRRCGNASCPSPEPIARMRGGRGTNPHHRRVEAILSQGRGVSGGRHAPSQGESVRGPPRHVWHGSQDHSCGHR